MVDWITDSVYQYKNCLLEELVSSFVYSRQDELKELRKYLKAVRSLVVAHPLSTSRYKDLGLDGNTIYARANPFRLVLEARMLEDSELMESSRISIRMMTISTYTFTQRKPTLSFSSSLSLTLSMFFM